MVSNTTENFDITQCSFNLQHEELDRKNIVGLFKIHVHSYIYEQCHRSQIVVLLSRNNQIPPSTCEKQHKLTSLNKFEKLTKNKQKKG